MVPECSLKTQSQLGQVSEARVSRATSLCHFLNEISYMEVFNKINNTNLTFKSSADYASGSHLPS